MIKALKKLFKKCDHHYIDVTTLGDKRKQYICTKCRIKKLGEVL